MAVDVSTLAPRYSVRRTTARASVASGSLARVIPWVVGISITATAGVLRFVNLGALGFNSDEVVYAAQGGAIAGDPRLTPFFPVFRAHPLVFQTILSLNFHLDLGDVAHRSVAALFGMGTVLLVYLLGRDLYGPRAGATAALFMAAMPYHVLVTRQVLLDGPMTFFATLTLFLVSRFAATQRISWLYAAAGTMGLTILTKETSIILLGALYAFFALTPAVKLRLRQLVMCAVVMVLVISPFPLTLALSGRTKTGENYLAWQLFRRPNHPLSFYPDAVPPAIGGLVLVTAVLGLVLMRRSRGWKERLLLSWILVPVCFFELWPVKGFQYLLPISVPLSILAARAIAAAPAALAAHGWRDVIGARRVATAVTIVIALSLAVPTWTQVRETQATTFLAGSGGLPAGREAGRWIGANVPKGAQILTVGPSMANVVQYYGNRKAYGLSVSPNPLHRNPSYEPVHNPDLKIRTNDIQYVVWDAFSAARTKFFSRRLLGYADRYNGRVVHTETVQVKTARGNTVRKPVIVVYEVRP